MPPAPLLEIIRAAKVYPAADGHQSLSILHDISLTIAPGERLSVVGPSGSGKSTLLHLMGSLDLPSSGKILFKGQDLSGLSDEKLSALRNREIGFIFQNHHLLPQCSLLENVLTPGLAQQNRIDRATSDRARHLLERVGLQDRMHHRPGSLSGGECQRAAVVRALINQPSLLLADEPTGALDRKNAEALADLLIELNREEQVALVVVTHAAGLAGRMKRKYALSEGRLILQ